MRCPKCGAFLDEGRETCFMCGGKTGTSSPVLPQNNMNVGNVDIQPKNSEIKYDKYGKRKFDDYKNIKMVEPERKPFDKEKFLKRVKMIVVAVVVSVVIIGGINFFASGFNTEKEKPVFGNLYFKIDNSYDLNSEETNKLFYLKDNSIENECSIELTKGKNQDDNHESVFFDTIRGMLEEENMYNPTAYQTKDGKITANGSFWFYLNVLYDSGENVNFLKTRYLTAVYDGVFYNVKLTNVKNDSQCALELDQFVESFKFVE